MVPRIIFIGGVLATLVFAFVRTAGPSARDNITAATVARIRDGMSVDEVARIVGRPADYVDNYPIRMGKPGDKEMMHKWYGTTGDIRVHFIWKDNQFRVVSAKFTAEDSPPGWD